MRTKNCQFREVHSAEPFIIYDISSDPTVYHCFHASDLGIPNTLLWEGMNSTPVISVFAFSWSYRFTLPAGHWAPTRIWPFTLLIGDKDSSLCQSDMWSSAVAGRSHSSPFSLIFLQNSCLLRHYSLSPPSLFFKIEHLKTTVHIAY